MYSASEDSRACLLVGDGVHLEPLESRIVTATGATNEVVGRFTVCRNDRHDKAAAGMPLTLESSHEDAGQEPPSLSAVTDADGRFTFPAVPAGPYQLWYTPPAGYQSSNPNVGNFIQLLVTGDDVRWTTSELLVTTTDPTTSCV